MKINKVIIFFVFFLFTTSNFELYSKVKLNNAQKQLQDSLKKELNLKKAEFKETDAGYKYILLETKQKHKIIADSMGNIIFPIESTIMCNKIEHIKPGKYFDWSCSPSIKDPYKYGTFKAEAISDDNTTIYFVDFNGTIINSYQGNKIKFQEKDPLCIVEVTNYGRKQHGLMTCNGIEVLSAHYNAINLNSYGAILEQTDRWGCNRTGALIFNPQKEIIPCKFYKVNYSNNEWQVQPHRIDKMTSYNANNIYDCDFQDQGQVLFEMGRFNDVIEYYSNNIPTDTLSYLYDGISRFHYANNLYNDIITQLNIASPTKPILINEELDLKTQLLNAYHLLESANISLGIYSNSLNPIYFPIANDYVSKGYDKMVEIEVKYDSFNKLIIEYNKRHKEYKAKLARQEAERKKRQENQNNSSNNNNRGSNTRKGSDNNNVNQGTPPQKQNSGNRGRNSQNNQNNNSKKTGNSNSKNIIKKETPKVAPKKSTTTPRKEQKKSNTTAPTKKASQKASPQKQAKIAPQN